MQQITEHEPIVETEFKQFRIPKKFILLFFPRTRGPSFDLSYFPIEWAKCLYSHQRAHLRFNVSSPRKMAAIFLITWSSSAVTR